MAYGVVPYIVGLDNTYEIVAEQFSVNQPTMAVSAFLLGMLAMRNA